MSKIVLLFAICFLILLVVSALRNRAGSGKIAYPYRLVSPLFSPAERSFLGLLDSAVGPEHRVFGKVRVADIAAPKAALGNSRRQAALNRVAYKHFDFVVCRASDLSVVCVVELNDKSHAGKRAKARDELVAQICRVIGLPLMTVPARQAYRPQEIAALFAAATSPVAIETAGPGAA